MKQPPPAKLSWAIEWLKEPLRHYINGQWVSSKGTTFTLHNPYSEEALCQYSCATSQEINAAIHAAKKCFHAQQWHKLPMRERAKIMRDIGSLCRKYQDELATLESLANGKTYQEAYWDDLPDCADIFDYYAGWIDKHYGESIPVNSGFLNYTRTEPLGVCAQIVPWNFPLLMAMWKLAPALATGNCVILKPSEYTPLSLVRFFQIIDEHLDLPPGLINLLLGDGPIGEQLCLSPEVQKVAFTGSTRVGKKIVRASAESNLKSVSLELGGKSPCLFFADTKDLEGALKRAHHVMFSHKGEKCSEPTRFLIEQSIYEEACEILKSLTYELKPGDPFDPETTQGPQCYKKHQESIMKYQAIAQQEGLVNLTPSCHPLPKTGYFVAPTIYKDVPPSSRLFQEEIFGPILCLTAFDSEEQAITLANATRYGLASGLYTSDVSRAHRIADAMEAGMVFINHYGCYEFSSPFGGFKESGWGKEMARDSLDLYTKKKSIWLKY